MPGQENPTPTSAAHFSNISCGSTGADLLMCAVDVTPMTSF